MGVRNIVVPEAILEKDRAEYKRKRNKGWAGNKGAPSSAGTAAVQPAKKAPSASKSVAVSKPKPRK